MRHLSDAGFTGNVEATLEARLGRPIDPALRYTFRTAPLRNLKVSPGFFHNGAFHTLEAAIAHHLDVEASLVNYDPRANKVPSDLSLGPFEGILEAGIGPLLQSLIPGHVR